MKKFLLLFLLILGLNANSLIKIAIKNPPNNLNPIYYPDNEIVNLIYLGLFYKNNNKDLIPALVKSYKVSSDGLKYQFTLREKLFFVKNDINYGELNTEDVKTTFEIIQNRLFNSANYEKLKNVKTFKIIDKYNFEIDLYERDNEFLNKLTFAIMSKNALIKYGISWFNSDSIGLGSYQLKQYSDEQIVLIKNNFSIFKPLNNGLVFKLFQNDAQIKNAINNKQIDFGFLEYKQIKNLNRDNNIKELNTNKVIAMKINNHNFNKELRYAISLIVCKKDIETLFPYLNSYNSKMDCNKQKAKEILNQLGYFKEKRSIELNLNKETQANYFKKLDMPLSIKLYVNNKENIEITKNISMQLNDFGINTKIYNEEDEENEGISIVSINIQNKYNLSELFTNNKTSNALNQKFYKNFYKEFQNQVNTNQDYIMLANHKYYAISNPDIIGIDTTKTDINQKNLLLESIKWQKYE